MPIDTGPLENWIRIVSKNVGNLPEWKYTCWYDAAAAILYVPHVYVDESQDKVFMMIAFDGDTPVSYKNKLFVPLRWAEKQDLGHPLWGAIKTEARRQLLEIGVTPIGV